MNLIETLSKIADEVEIEIAKIPDSKSKCKNVAMGADGTCTSQIDKIAENIVLEYIERNKVPLNVLSEEIGFVDNGAEETLILDPIDGTSNAIAGVPLFTISMAVGKNTMADVHTAYLRNLVTKDVYCAIKGKGAFKNGERITVRKPVMNDLFLMIYLGNGAHPDSFKLAKRAVSSRSYGCASLEMALVAEGEADGFMMYSEKHSRSIRIIDIAASALILREAGGEIFDLEGNILDMDCNLECRANFIAYGDVKVFDWIKGSKKKAHLNYGIHANMAIPESKEYVKRVMNCLKDENFILDSVAAEHMGYGKGCPVEDMDVDVLITIGGDGTILRTLLKNDSPLIGINAGDVGFLTEIDVDDIEEGILKLKNGEYTIEERFKISSFYNNDYFVEAVNEVVVHTDTVAKIRHFKVYVNDILVTEVRADGVLISTPTGSTCYAMSLGAPIVDPRVNAFVIVPMAAYKFISRPFVVPADTKVTVELVMNEDCLIVIDGQKTYPIQGKTKIDFTKSCSTVKFIKFDTDFYSRLREKLVKMI